MTLTQGQILNNRYRIVALLGKGGFGAVYKAWDTRLQINCAVKESLETTPQALRQFQREAQILASMRHPNLPRVTDHFSLPGQGQYLVMDFVGGQDLEELCRAAGGRLPEAQVLGWIAQVCEALDYLHRQSPPVIHRDIKPANIKITPSGQAVLVDFGIAKTYDPHLKTTQGARAVTAGFSPIEQYGRGATDARTDIYSLGATLYTLLTGEELPEATQRAVHDLLVPPRQLNPAISPAIEAALLHALQIDPARRFQNAAELRAAITGQLPTIGSQSPIVTQLATTIPPPSGQVRAAGGTPGGGSAPLPSSFTPAGMKISQPIRPFPWKWLALGAGLFAGLALLAVLAVLALKGLSSSPTQPALARPTRTAEALADLPTPSPSPLPPTLTPSLTASPKPALPTLTPSAVPTTRTPTPSRSPTPVLPTVVVEPYCEMFDQSPAIVSEHQPVTLWWRWDALTRAQVEDHIAAAQYEIYLDGRRIFAQWQTDIIYLSGDGLYRVSWYAEVGALSTGTHITERFLSWTRQIFDGWDYYGPGSDIVTEYDRCEIIVRAP